MRGVGGREHNRKALELFYRLLIMGDSHGEALQLAACGMLVRVRGPSALLRRLRAHAARVRTAPGPASPPRPLAVAPEAWLQEAPFKGSPYRRRLHQWRVVFKSTIVARNRPSTKGVISDCFKPGDLLWSGTPRADGWLPLSDSLTVLYILVDATPLGLGRLLEPVEPCILEEGACEACKAKPCCCELLAACGL